MNWDGKDENPASIRCLKMRSQFATVLLRLKPVAPQQRQDLLRMFTIKQFSCDRGIGMSVIPRFTPIHPERSRMATIPPTVPPRMSPIPLR